MPFLTFKQSFNCVLNLSNFHNGGSKGKGVVDNLFLLRALIDHSKYMGKQL